MPGQYTAFSEKHTRQITDVITTLTQRMLQTLTPCPSLDYDDVMRLLGVGGELKKFLMEGRRLADIYEHEANTVSVPFGDNDATMGISMYGGDKHPLVPRNPVIDYDWLNNDERGRQLTKRSRELVQIADDWGVVGHVFAQLNEKLQSEAQMRYVWPSVMALMANSEDETTLALRDKLLPLKVPRELPPLPVELRALIRRASAAVTMATMLPATWSAAPKGNVIVSFTTSFKNMGEYYRKQITA